MDEDKDLRNQLEEIKTQNINLRFDKVEKELTEIKNLLKEYVLEIKANREEALKITKLLDDRLLKLEEACRNCPIKSVKAELGRYARETSFIRAMFKNPWKGAIIMSVWMILVTVLVIVFGPDAIFEMLMKIKGL
jgi:predicted transcriptional regulator